MCFWSESYFKTSDDTNKVEIVNEECINELISQVYYDYLENSIIMDGVVVNEEEPYQKSSNINVKDVVKIKCRLNTMIKKGDVIYIVNGKKYVSEVDGMVIDIIHNKEVISVSILDFSKQFIDAKMNYVYLDKIKVGDELDVVETNPLSEKIIGKEKVKRLGYEVNENMVDIYLSNREHYLPGTQLRVKLSYKDEIRVCYVLKQMLNG